MRTMDLARELYSDPMELLQHQVARRVRASWNRVGKRRVQRMIREAEALLDSGSPSAGLVWAIAGFEVFMRSIIDPGLKAVIPLAPLAKKLADDFFLGNAKADRFRKLIPMLLGVDFLELDSKSWRFLTDERKGAVRKRNRVVHLGERVGARDARTAIRAVKNLFTLFTSKIHELAPDRIDMLLSKIVSASSPLATHSESRL